MTQPPTWWLPAPQIRLYSDIVRVISLRIIIIIVVEPTSEFRVSIGLRCLETIDLLFNVVILLFSLS